MPEISRFFGITIHMFWETGTQHHAPHLHVYYQEHKATYRIDTIELLAGSLPRRQQRFVEGWLEMYQEELIENWQLANLGQPLNKVAPLQRKDKK